MHREFEDGPEVVKQFLRPPLEDPVRQVHVTIVRGEISLLVLKQGKAINRTGSSRCFVMRSLCCVVCNLRCRFSLERTRGPFP